MRPTLSLAILVAGALAACESPRPAPPPAASAAASVAEPTPPPGPTIIPTADIPTQVVALHVLVAFTGADRAPKGITRSKADAKKRAEEVAARAKKGEDFTELVKKYSDEPGAADRLGSVGRFARDAMARPFSDAAFALEIGATSDAVETPFGFHVIKRTQ